MDSVQGSPVMGERLKDIPWVSGFLTKRKDQLWEHG